MLFESSGSHVAMAVAVAGRQLQLRSYLQPLAWELPYVPHVALKSKKEKKGYYLHSHKGGSSAFTGTWWRELLQINER